MHNQTDTELKTIGRVSLEHLRSGHVCGSPLTRLVSNDDKEKD